MSGKLSESLSERDTGEDKISNLPDSVIDHIFSFLPIKETGKTSILSRNWRYKWKIVSCLVFEHNLAPLIDKDKEGSMLKFVNYVDRILLLHYGLICKFELFYVGYELPGEDLDKWILHISKQPVKKFVLGFGYSMPEYKMTSCFFSCRNLTHLMLQCCSLKPPSTFKGFKCLKRLELRRVFVQQEVCEILVSSCMLEKLSLIRLSGLESLRINAPNLHQFDFTGSISKLSFKNTSRVAMFFIFVEQFHPGDDEKLSKLIGKMPQLERLHINNACRDLDSGVIQRSLPASFHNLRYLCMTVDFSGLKATSTLLCLLRCAPNLQVLDIASFMDIDEPSDNIWQVSQWRWPFTRLRRVELSICTVLQAQIDFVYLLLLSSPGLEKMTVEYRGKIMSDERKRENQTLMNLLFLKRVSPQAELIFT